MGSKLRDRGFDKNIVIFLRNQRSAGILSAKINQLYWVSGKHADFLSATMIQTNQTTCYFDQEE